MGVALFFKGRRGLDNGLVRSVGRRGWFRLRQLRLGGLRPTLLGLGFLLRKFLAVVVPDNARDVGMRLAIGRNTVVLLHSPRTGVVGSQRLGHIEVILLQQLAQIT